MSTFSAVSMIPAVKTQLLALMANRAGLAEVQRSYADPAGAREAECLWFGDASGTHEIDAMRAGRKTRKEKATVELYAWCYLAAGTPEEAEARTFVLMGEIEDLLAEDPQIGIGPALEWVRLGEIRSADCGPREEGADAVLIFTIEFQARLS